MSIPKPPFPAKLVIGIFMKEKHLFESIAKELVSINGAADIISSWFLFDYTSYYEKEMGTPLFRRLMAFETLIKQSSLPVIKNRTNELELEYSTNGSRIINVDPGYMLQERFVLATCKNYAHRIYIGKGVYADLTLTYTKGAFCKLPWTYPDYAEKNMQNFLIKVRNKYVADLKQVYRP